MSRRRILAPDRRSRGARGSRHRARTTGAAASGEHRRHPPRAAIGLCHVHAASGDPRQVRVRILRCGVRRDSPRSIRRRRRGVPAMAEHYPIETEGYSFALPYFAWAAAKTGDAAGLEKFLLGRKGAKPAFDLDLAYAFFHGARKERHARSSCLIQRYVGTRSPTTDPCSSSINTPRRASGCTRRRATMPFWTHCLYGSLVSKRFSRHTRGHMPSSTPMRTPERKRRALAMTLYLDPESPRIRAVSAKERAEAQAWGGANNPFLQADDPPDDGGPTAQVRVRTKPPGLIRATGNGLGLSRRLSRTLPRTLPERNLLTGSPRLTGSAHEEDGYSSGRC